MVVIFKVMPRIKFKTVKVERVYCMLQTLARVFSHLNHMEDGKVFFTPDV